MRGIEEKALILADKILEYSKNFYELLYVSKFGFGLTISKIEDNFPVYSHFIPYASGNMLPSNHDFQLLDNFLEKELVSPKKFFCAIEKIKKDYPELSNSERFEFIPLENSNMAEKVFYQATIVFYKPEFLLITLDGNFEEIDNLFIFSDDSNLDEIRLFSPMWKIFAKVNGKNIEVKDYYASVYMVGRICKSEFPHCVF